MSEVLRKQIYRTLISMLNSSDDIVRGAAGGCLGALLSYLGDGQVDEFLSKHLLVEESDESHLKHGYTTVLYVGLKESYKVLLKSAFKDKLEEFLVQITSSTKGVPIPQSIVSAYVRAMNHPSNEVKQLVAKSCNYLAKNVSAEQIPVEVLKYFVPMLVNGTKEKNSYVKSNSEIALLAILHLREDEVTYQRVHQVLEVGARDSLSEVVSKVLRKAVLQPIGKDEELDETLLS